MTKKHERKREALRENNLQGENFVIIRYAEEGYVIFGLRARGMYSIFSGGAMNEDNRNLTRYTTETTTFSGWRVSICRKGITLTVYFADSVYGGAEGSRAAAVALRDEIFARIAEEPADRVLREYKRKYKRALEAARERRRKHAKELARVRARQRRAEARAVREAQRAAGEAERDDDEEPAA